MIKNRAHRQLIFTIRSAFVGRSESIVLKSMKRCKKEIKCWRTLLSRDDFFVGVEPLGERARVWDHRFTIRGLIFRLAPCISRTHFEEARHWRSGGRKTKERPTSRVFSHKKAREESATIINAARRRKMRVRFFSLFISLSRSLSRCRNRDREGSRRYSLRCWIPTLAPHSRGVLFIALAIELAVHECARTEKPSGYSAASRVESLEFISTLSSRPVVRAFALNHPARTPTRPRERRDIKLCGDERAAPKP